MIAALTISVLSILGMIASVFFFPIISLGKYKIQTFYFAPLIGAILLLVFNLVDRNLVLSSMIDSSSVNPLQILAIFLSMVFISVVLDEVGFFKYLASEAVKHSKNSQVSMFIMLYVVVSILTIFTSNDIIVITFTPFIIFFCNNAKIKPLPYLISEFVGANTWSMLFIIGNPTNIYLASNFNIDFFTYFIHMLIPTFFGGISSLVIMLLVFRKSLKAPLNITLKEERILDKPIFLVSLILLIVCIILLAISSFIGLEMWMISSISALTLLIFFIIYAIFKKEKAFLLKESVKRIPFNLIPLLLSMFVIVLTLRTYDVTEHLYDLLNTSQPILSYGFASLLTANLINNIPMSVLFVDVIENFPLQCNQAIFASIISSNIAAFFTPMGALAGMMFMGILKKGGVDFTFKKFVMYGSIISIPTLIFSLLGLYLSFYLIG